MEKMRILVPTDISDTGNTAFKTAAIIRQIFKGKIIPMYTFREVVWPDGVSMPNLESGLTAEIKKQVKNRLRMQAEKYCKPEHISEPVVAYGEPVSQILKQSDECDLIVMSTHGRKGFAKAVMGSVTGKIVRNLKKPIVVTRGLHEKDDKISKILITTDFSEASYTAFPMAKTILERTKASADLVHVISLEHTKELTDGKELAAKRKDDLEKLKQKYFKEVAKRISTQAIISFSSVHERLISLIEEQKYDLVVMATTGKSGVKYILLGSCVARVTERSESPVLII